MTNKTFPLNDEFIRQIAEEFGTPFYIYFEKEMRENARRLVKAFSWAPAFKEFFAVKALPNPYILKILKEEGFGADCSSLPELVLSEKVGIIGEEICFTSNDTPASEFIGAKKLGAIINLDDISHLEFVEKHTGMPEIICCRYNPGPSRGGGNTIIGYPEEAKYGMTKEQVISAIKSAKEKGAKRFGLHAMIVSNELNIDYLVGTAEMMFNLAIEVKERTGVEVEFINLGGGIGVAYHPDEEPVDLEKLGEAIHKKYDDILLPHGMDKVKLYMENGRVITGPYGFLVATVLHKKDIYKQYVGLDACMVNLMRPAMYGAYHHITVVGKRELPHDHIYDVTGSLCENTDKFAINRSLPEINIGDLVIIHDAGAHGYAMGSNYNAKLRCKELLYKENGEIEVIRRAETMDDYFATLDFSRL